MPFVPQEFYVPRGLRTDRFLLEPLGGLVVVDRAHPCHTRLRRPVVAARDDTGGETSLL